MTYLLTYKTQCGLYNNIEWSLKQTLLIFSRQPIPCTINDVQQQKTPFHWSCVSLFVRLNCCNCWMIAEVTGKGRQRRDSHLILWHVHLIHIVRCTMFMEAER